MKRAYPEVYNIVKNNNDIGYGRVFSEPRSDGLRRIKFWMAGSTHGFGAKVTKDQIDNLLNELYELDYVVYAGYQGRSYKSRKVPSNGMGFMDSYIEVFVK